jgi:hypothetical protein
MRAKYEPTGKAPSDYRLTRKANHYFAAKLSETAQTVRIVVKDRFGNEWSEDIKVR